MSNEISQTQINRILESSSIEERDAAGLLNGFMLDEKINANRPDPGYKIDPRDGSVILFSSVRAKRPHDNEEVSVEMENENSPVLDCPVCEGNTTKVIDLSPLSKGFSFINRNLFPILFPDDGAHFLQWSSNRHDNDWHNMSLDDRTILLQRLSSLEKKLLFPDGSFESGYVSIIKNKGAAVGGSLDHGHQQIAWSRVMPAAFEANLRFQKANRVTFDEFMLSENDPDLTVKSYRHGRLVVPFFMKRPYNMLYLNENPEKKYLYQLTDSEIESAAEAVGDCLKSYHQLLPSLGKETAYNFLIHSGPGAGLYIEFLPYTQETGGFEQLGLWVCQGSALKCAHKLKDLIDPCINK